MLPLFSMNGTKHNNLLDAWAVGFVEMWLNPQASMLPLLSIHRTKDDNLLDAWAMFVCRDVAQPTGKHAALVEHSLDKTR